MFAFTFNIRYYSTVDKKKTLNLFVFVCWCVCVQWNVRYVCV